MKRIKWRQSLLVILRKFMFFIYCTGGIIGGGLILAKFAGMVDGTNSKYGILQGFFL